MNAMLKPITPDKGLPTVTRIRAVRPGLSLESAPWSAR